VPEHGQTLPPTQPGHYGAAGIGARLAEATIAAAWNVQGNAEHLPLAYQVQAQFGIVLPIASNTTARSGAMTALWLGPSSWLLVAGEAGRLVGFDATREALNAAGGALFDLSDARVGWTISGPRAATVLAKSCPLDFHPRAFRSGTCAQSLFGHVNALFVRDGEVFTLLVARSFAPDVGRALSESAAQYGYEVGPPAPYR